MLSASISEIITVSRNQQALQVACHINWAPFAFVLRYIMSPASIAPQTDRKHACMWHHIIRRTMLEEEQCWKKNNAVREGVHVLSSKALECKCVLIRSLQANDICFL